MIAFVGYLAPWPARQLVENVARPADWEFALCDIGQGDATIIRSQGMIALDDTGPDPARMQHCLDELGITHIDLLVLTHYDLDHVGGVSAVYGKVDRVLIGPPSDPGDIRIASDLRANGAAGRPGQPGRDRDAGRTPMGRALAAAARRGAGQSGERHDPGRPERAPARRDVSAASCSATWAKTRRRVCSAPGRCATWMS